MVSLKSFPSQSAFESTSSCPRMLGSSWFIPSAKRNRTPWRRPEGVSPSTGTAAATFP